MNPRLPRALRYPAQSLRVPDADASPNRAPIPADALRAAYGAHAGHDHQGRRGLGCRTCRRYIESIVAARATERQAHP